MRVIEEFLSEIRLGRIETYNEFSLQHELGVFLRTRGAFAGRKVQFERNAGYFAPGTRQRWTKREIDISVFADATRPELAIELKFPRNGQVPETMFSFCKDIRFLEELRQRAGFTRALLLVLVDDPLFYQGDKTSGIYRFFRGNPPARLQGRIAKPTGSQASHVDLRGSYQVRWRPIDGALWYFAVEV
jgi:hypothetical protein